MVANHIILHISMVNQKPLSSRPIGFTMITSIYKVTVQIRLPQIQFSQQIRQLANRSNPLDLGRQAVVDLHASSMRNPPAHLCPRR